MCLNGCKTNQGRFPPLIDYFVPFFHISVFCFVFSGPQVCVPLASSCFIFMTHFKVERREPWRKFLFNLAMIYRFKSLLFLWFVLLFLLSSSCYYHFCHSFMNLQQSKQLFPLEPEHNPGYWHLVLISLLFNLAKSMSAELKLLTTCDDMKSSEYAACFHFSFWKWLNCRWFYKFEFGPWKVSFSIKIGALLHSNSISCLDEIYHFGAINVLRNHGEGDEDKIISKKSGIFSTETLGQFWPQVVIFRPFGPQHSTF